MNRCFKILSSFFLLLIFSQTLFSQNKLTVEQAITATIENNYDIQLLRNDSISYALNKSYARAAFLPRVNEQLAWFTITIIKNKNLPTAVKEKVKAYAPIIYQVLCNLTGQSLTVLKCLLQEINFRNLYYLANLI